MTPNDELCQALEPLLRVFKELDFFMLTAGSFDRASFQRNAKTTLGRLTDVHFCTAEDMILRKLEWFRAGGEISERQWSDVLGLLQVQKNALDREYLNHWASQLNLNELLEKACREAQCP